MNRKEFIDQVIEILNNPQADFSWISHSSLTSRAFWIGVALGSKSFSEECYESSLREAAFATYMIREGDNPYNYCESKKSIDRLLRKLHHQTFDDSFFDELRALQERLRHLNRIWSELLEHSKFCVNELEKSVVSSNEEGVSRSSEDSVARELNGYLKELEDCFERLESLTLPTNSFDRASYDGS